MRTKLIIETPKELLKALSKIRSTNEGTKIPSIKSITIEVTLVDAKLFVEPGDHIKDEIDISEVDSIEFLKAVLETKDVHLNDRSGQYLEDRINSEIKAQK